MKTKVCTKCKVRRFANLRCFRVDCRKKDGLHSWCKSCENIWHKEYYQRNKYKAKSRIQKYQATLIGCIRRIYANMKQRCTDPIHDSYKHYGGRGVKLKFTSNEFVDYVVNTLKADPRGLQVDRINTNGNYEPGNIRFVTAKENSNNRRRKNEY